jgi:hypothetical protein
VVRLPFVPYAIWKDLFFAAFILLAVAACALYFGPFGPTGRPDPTIIQTVPKPDYFFLWLYALLSLLPPPMETPALLIGPVVVIIGLLLLPFLSGEGEKSWRRRPIAVLTVYTHTSRACTVLECFRNDPHGMACASTVYIGDAFRSMALFRAGVVLGGWVSFLFNLGRVSQSGRNGRPFYTFFLPRCRATSSLDFYCSLTALRTPCIFRRRGTLAFLF